MVLKNSNMYIYTTAHFIVSYSYIGNYRWYFRNQYCAEIIRYMTSACCDAKTRFCGRHVGLKGWAVMSCRLWMYKPFHLVFKYLLIDFVFYQTVWWAKFTEASSKTLTVQILIIWQFETLFIS